MANKELWDKACIFHGHECPGLAIGVRACESAIEKLGFSSAQDEEFACVTENDACCVDAVQAILGCTLGKGNLVYRGTGKIAFSFFCRESGRSLRAYFKAEKPDNIDRNSYIKYILSAPIDELFDFAEPKFSAPEKARQFVSVTCEMCGEIASEHKIRFQNGKTVCLDCFRDYDRGFVV